MLYLRFSYPLYYPFSRQSVWNKISTSRHARGTRGKRHNRHNTTSTAPRTKIRPYAKTVPRSRRREHARRVPATQNNLFIISNASSFVFSTDSIVDSSESFMLPEQENIGLITTSGHFISHFGFLDIIRATSYFI